MPPRRQALTFALAAAGAVTGPGLLLERQRARRPPRLPPAQTGLRTIDGVRVRYAESDGPVEQTILLTGPWPKDIDVYAPLWATLADRFHLVAIDLPGFGASERRADLLSPRAMGSFLVQVIAELDLGRPHLVGPGVGTAAALFAAAYSPGSVASLVVGGGATAVPLEIGEPLSGWIHDADLDRYRSLDPSEIVRTALGNAGVTVPAGDDLPGAGAGDSFVESLSYVRRYPEELPVLEQRLGEIDTPVLIIAGVRDEIVPFANAEFLAARLPRNRLAPVDAGHFVWEEAPDEFAALIADWAERPGSTTSDSPGASVARQEESRLNSTERRSA